MISIPVSCLTYFRRDPSLRLGQSMFDFLKLHKLRDQKTKKWADELYAASDEVARKMIEAAIDMSN